MIDQGKNGDEIKPRERICIDRMQPTWSRLLVCDPRKLYILNYTVTIILTQHYGRLFFDTFVFAFTREIVSHRRQSHQKQEDQARYNESCDDWICTQIEGEGASERLGLTWMIESLGWKIGD